MATCQESFAGSGGIENVQVIFPSTLTPWEATGTTNQLFRIESLNAQTITFIISVSSAPVSVGFTLFRLMPDGSITTVGSSNVNSANSTFTFEVLSGTYIMCVHRNGFVNQNGTVVAVFVSRPFFQTLPLSSFFGESVRINDLVVPKPERECHEPIFFELVDGELPPGIILDRLGAVIGELPNLDCLPDAVAPGVGFYEEIEGIRYPFGRMWRFKIRIYTATTKPNEIKEEWFCIRVHNNWNLDTENFLKQAPFEKVMGLTVVEEIERLDDVCVPCDKMADIEKFVPKPLTVDNCAPCNAGNQNTKVSLIEIPEELCGLSIDGFGPWFIQTEFDSIDNQYAREFYESLKNSSEFRVLLSKMGYSPEENVNEFAIVNTYENFLQITVTEPVETDPESYAGLVEQWRMIQNQNLPFMCNSRGGENVQLNLT